MGTGAVSGVDTAIYPAHDLDFETFRHLDDIGLATLMGPGSSFSRYTNVPIEISYFGERFMLDLPVGAGGKISIGRVMLTAIGAELAPISGAEAIPDFRDFILSRWQNLLKPVPTS